MKRGHFKQEFIGIPYKQLLVDQVPSNVIPYVPFKAAYESGPFEQNSPFKGPSPVW